MKATPYIVAFFVFCLGLLQTRLMAEDLTATFIYQGELRQGPAPINDAADFLAILYDAPTDGAQVGVSASFSNVPVEAGLFELPLTFNPSDFNGQRRWLEIAVRRPTGSGEFTTLTPRQEITAAPYALQTRGLFVNDDKLVGVGTITPTAALHIFKPVGSPADASLRITTDADPLIARRTMSISGGSINVDGLLSAAPLSLQSASMGNVNIASGGGDVILSSGAGQTLIGGPLASSNSLSECIVNGNFQVQQDNEAGLLVIPQESHVEFNYAKGGTTVVQMRMASSYVSLANKLAVNRLSSPDHPLQVGNSAFNGNGAHVTDGGVWTNGSDAGSKTDYMPIDTGAILEKVAALPVTQWRYKSEPEGVKHIGPTAQDFMAAFGLGESERHIGTVDEIGVALAAIQALSDKVKEQEEALARQGEILARLESKLERIMDADD